MQYMIELGIYSQYADIPPTVVLSGPFEESELIRPSLLFETLQAMRGEAETKLGSEAADEAVFIRMFKR